MKPRAPEPALAGPAAGGGLVYVEDRHPGIRRVAGPRGFSYRHPNGAPVRGAAELRRIAALAIPPAYTHVWICPLPNGHLQATGRDARGRKQYRYHPDWIRLRDERKFEQLRAFGEALPAIRARVERDLAQAGAGVTRERVLAAIVRLLDATFVRIGNRAYARDNGSFGLTTLLNRHASARGATLQLAFEGKSGVRQRVGIDDARVARIVRQCRQLPGQTLFQYVDVAGALHRVDSGEVNDYIHAAANAAQRFTAKDFRTWHASTLALDEALARLQAAPQPRLAPRALLEPVARQLGNTVAVCKKAYVHPAILEWYAGQACLDEAAVLRRVRARGRHSAAERRLLAFLARRC